MKSISHYIAILILFCLSHLYPQSIISTDQLFDILPSDNTQRWSAQKGDVYFYLVDDPQKISSDNLQIDVIDNHIETGIYYWVESFNAPAISSAQIPEQARATILWRKERTALVKAYARNFTSLLPDKYFVIYEDFSTPSRMTGSGLHKSNTPISEDDRTVNTILDSVNIDTIYTFVKELSGEKTFWLNGELDSLNTRFSYSSENIKAQEYIKAKLESYGYNVELQPFNISVGKVAAFTGAESQTGWLISGCKIFKTSDNGYSWSLQYEAQPQTLLNDIAVTDNQTVYVAGDDGLLLTTDSGGAYWKKRATDIQTDLVKVSFTDPQNGSIVTESGEVLSTTNGGQNWVSGNTQLLSRNNVIAVREGTTYPDQYYIICAHYDDISEDPMRYAPGADDNASGTATVMEAARILAGIDFKYSIRYILFSGEEQGLYGSNHYATNAALNGEIILGVINLDMIAYDSDNDGLVEIHEGTLLESQQLGDIVAQNISDWSLDLTAEVKTTNATSSSDHSPFWNEGYPAILLIEDFEDFTPYYHKTSDRISTFNKSYLWNNAKLAIGSLYEFAEDDSSPSAIGDINKPINFKLYNAYPNPFNPQTRIRYSLSVNSHVDLDVYNLLGQKVATLVSGRQPAGSYTVTWDATGFAGSVYFYKFQSDNGFSQTKKLVLLK